MIHSFRPTCHFDVIEKGSIKHLNTYRHKDAFPTLKREKKEKEKMKKIFSMMMLTLLLTSIATTLTISRVMSQIEEDGNVYDYSVPHIFQMDYEVIGGCACGPTSITMLLHYYFPHSGIDVPEVYNSGIQDYTYHRPATNYEPECAGMYSDAAAHYLNTIWGGQSESRDADLAEVVNEIKSGPLILNVWHFWYEDGVEKRSGHYVVLKGYNDNNTPDYKDNVFYVNDPAKSQPGSWDYDEFLKRRDGKPRIITFKPTLSEEQRKYTVVVDNDRVQLDDINAKDADGNYVWQRYYGWADSPCRGDWYYPIEGGHRAKWIPNLPVDGNYEIHAIFRKDNKQSDVTYTIYAPDNSMLGQKVVDQKGEGWTDENLGIFPLVKGSYVRVDNVPAQCNVDAIRFVYTGVTPTSFVPVDLVLVLDRSGSMTSSMGTKTRMQGAKDSAIAVVNALMSHDRVGVVSFASSGMTNVQLTSDFDYAKTEIQKISASGMTSFGAGLKLAVDELKARGSEDHAWAIIFMSDGWHNTAPSPDPYVLECTNLGIPIYTVGLGRYPSDVNEALLKQMAEKTGGKYLFAPSTYELENIFLRFSLEATGWPLVGEFSGLVGEGQTVVAGTFDVDPLTDYARVTLNWPGSDLDLIIVRPDGSEVELGTGLDNTYSGATAKPEWVILHDPPAGTWTVKVYGKVINSPDEPFIVWISTYVPPVPHDTTPPTTSLTIGTPQYIDGLGNTYVASTTEFTLDAIDNGDAGSGVATTAYEISNTTYSTGWITYTAPFNLTSLSDGAYTIAYNSTDNAGNIEPTNTAIIILDNTGPSVTILNPPPGWALQDGVTFIASSSDASGTYSLNFSIREADGDQGIPVGFEDMPATYNATTGKWELFFNTLQLPDGFYIVLVSAEDNLGHTASIPVPYSIRNWAVLELLPATPNNKAGRTMPVKFALRVAASVDPNQPFVYNEELTIKIYATDNPSNILQTSTFGDTARDYRINTLSEQYITNFQTLKTPKTYMVEIWRKNMLIGTFKFKTVK